MFSSYRFETHPALPAAQSGQFPLEVFGSHCHLGQVFGVLPAGKMAERKKKKGSVKSILTKNFNTTSYIMV